MRHSPLRGVSRRGSSYHGAEWCIQRIGVVLCSHSHGKSIGILVQCVWSNLVRTASVRKCVSSGVAD